MCTMINIDTGMCAMFNIDISMCYVNELSIYLSMFKIDIGMYGMLNIDTGMCPMFNIVCVLYWTLTTVRVLC